MESIPHGLGELHMVPQVPERNLTASAYQPEVSMSIQFVLSSDVAKHLHIEKRHVP